MYYINEKGHFSRSIIDLKVTFLLMYRVHCRPGLTFDVKICSLEGIISPLY